MLSAFNNFKGSANKLKDSTPKPDTPDFIVSNLSEKQSKAIQAIIEKNSTCDMTNKINNDNSHTLTIDFKKKNDIKPMDVADLYMELRTIVTPDNIKASDEVKTSLRAFLEKANEPPSTSITSDKKREIDICNEVLNSIDPSRTPSHSPRNQ